MIRVLIAEDSMTCLELLTDVLGTDPSFAIIGHAEDGARAVAMTKELRPDVIVMDANMPVMDGFEATRQIMVEAPTPIVIVSATVNVREVAVSLHALRVGALALLPKPTLRDQSDLDAQARQFTSSIRAMSEVRVVQRWHSKPPRPITKHILDAPISIIAIAASTGGPGAIYRVLSELPAELPVPVVVVQHIAVGFVEGLATWLNGASALTVKVAEQNERMKAGFVYIAPDSCHLGLSDSYTAQISDGPAIGGFRPSATFMFEAVARKHSRGALAVVLTGMGEDGLPGLHAIHAAGGRILAQDEATSVVFGMPGAAVAAGIADAILPLEMVAPRLKSVIAESNRPMVRQ
jgi:two-component system, chemotaxis family, protein-glutamate methylesterase/glutaminase